MIENGTGTKSSKCRRPRLTVFHTACISELFSTRRHTVAAQREINVALGTCTRMIGNGTCTKSSEGHKLINKMMMTDGCGIELESGLK